MIRFKWTAFLIIRFPHESASDDQIRCSTAIQILSTIAGYPKTIGCLDDKLVSARWAPSDGIISALTASQLVVWQHGLRSDPVASNSKVEPLLFPVQQPKLQVELTSGDLQL